jgi:pimeloyl-ACP methyl ester carboxylesterase
MRTVLADSAIAREHPVRLYAPPGPVDVLVIAADGEGAAHWANQLDGMSAAVVGIESNGLSGDPYEIGADPRARAYLADIDLPYFERHMAYALDLVLPWALEHTRAKRVVAFGFSNGAAWAAAAVLRRREAFAGALVFSLGIPPRPASGLPPHAFASGRLEKNFDRQTTRYARALRRRGVQVRHRRPRRGHDHDMWSDEFVPALRWVLNPARGAPSSPDR